MSLEVSSKSVGSGCCSDAVIDKLFQIRGAVELNARPANTVLSVGWDSSWWSDDRS